MKQTRLPVILMILTAALALLTFSIALAREGARQVTAGDRGAPSAETGVAMLQQAAFPFCEGFEGGSLPSYFRPITNSVSGANGRVAVTSAFPHGGSYALDLDTDCAGCGGSTTQAAVLAVDLAGENYVTLDFWVYEHIDESDPQDGIFISDDGGSTWAMILSLNGFQASYQQVSIDLVAAASGVGMGLVDDFLIKFQSLDNFSIPSDGYSFDDICVRPKPAISLVKTVGFDPAACASTDSVEITAATDVTYCYRVTNTGGVTLTLHDLIDSQLGKLHSGSAFTLPAGGSLIVTETANLNATAVNSATWTAYNPGPIQMVSSSDTATVTLVYPVYTPIIIKP